MSEITNMLLVSTAICLAPTKFNGRQDAYNKYLDAAYAQTGLDKMVNQTLKREEKQVPKELVAISAWLAVAFRISQEHQIKLAWRF